MAGVVTRWKQDVTEVTEPTFQWYLNTWRERQLKLAQSLVFRDSFHKFTKYFPAGWKRYPRLVWEYLWTMFGEASIQIKPVPMAVC